jgi:hypothetical protein
MLGAFAITQAWIAIAISVVVGVLADALVDYFWNVAAKAKW